MTGGDQKLDFYTTEHLDFVFCLSMRFRTKVLLKKNKNPVNTYSVFLILFYFFLINNCPFPG